MKKMYPLYLLAALCVFVAGVYIARGEILWLIDPPSAMLVFLPPVFLMLSHYTPGEMGKAFSTAFRGRADADVVETKNALLFFTTLQNLILFSMAITVLLGAILILVGIYRQQNESALVLSHWSSVALLALLYGWLAVMLVTLPFRGALRKKLNELR